jgi:hypothetical protein
LRAFSPPFVLHGVVRGYSWLLRSSSLAQSAAANAISSTVRSRTEATELSFVYVDGGKVLSEAEPKPNFFYRTKRFSRNMQRDWTEGQQPCL